MSAATPVRLARPEDRDIVIRTVVDAFAQDPAFRWFFEDRYDDLAAPFAAGLFDARVEGDVVWMTDDGDAVALWEGPEGPVAPHRSRHAIANMGTVRDRIRAYGAVVSSLLPDEPHWYLGVLASRHDRRGEGLATLVARHGLERAAQAGLLSALETTNRANVALYERRGWRVTGESTALPGLPVWVMVREPESGNDRLSS